MSGPLLWRPRVLGAGGVVEPSALERGNDGTVVLGGVEGKLAREQLLEAP